MNVFGMDGFVNDALKHLPQMESVWENTFAHDDGAGMAAMSKEDLIKLQLQERKSAQEAWDQLSDKEKCHHRMLMGGAAATKEEKN